MPDENLIDREKALFGYDGPDRVVHFTDYLVARKAMRSTVVAFLSGYRNFDEKLEGIAEGEVTVITGKTGEGKTLFAESLVRNILLENGEARAAYFSFEVTPEALLEKYQDSPSTPIYLPLELRAMDVEWLEMRIEEAKLKHGCQIFIIDHLHYLVDMATKQNMSLNIGGFMRKLKLMALRLRVAVILLAHQKGVAKGEEPSIEDVRDSSFIGQESDNVIVIWRRKDFGGEELHEMEMANPILCAAVRGRIDTGRAPLPDAYEDKFAFVQIAKARRSGTFRWKKLFQKSGKFLEEV